MIYYIVRHPAIMSLVSREYAIVSARKTLNNEDDIR